MPSFRAAIPLRMTDESTPEVEVDMLVRRPAVLS
jgi:hypothetical protein